MAVTLEEGLVALLAGAAAILLFVGLAQALDARPPRSAARARRRSSVRPARDAAPAPPEIPPRAPYTGPERRRSRRPGSRPRAAASTSPLAESRAGQPTLPLAPGAQPAAASAPPPP